MSGERIIRQRVVSEAVVVPGGHEVCSHCHGKGMLSKYDEGMRSFTHSAELAAPRECFVCHGVGYVPAASSGLGSET